MWEGTLHILRALDSPVTLWSLILAGVFVTIRLIWILRDD